MCVNSRAHLVPAVVHFAPPTSSGTATALLLFNEGYLADRFGTLPQHDADEVAEALGDLDMHLYA